jgi:hypothetical protein
MSDRTSQAIFNEIFEELISYPTHTLRDLFPALCCISKSYDFHLEDLDEPAIKLIEEYGEKV